MASVLFLEAIALGTLYTLAHTDPRLRATTEHQRRTLAVLAVIYYVAAIFSVIYALVR